MCCCLLHSIALDEQENVGWDSAREAGRGDLLALCSADAVRKVPVGIVTGSLELCAWRPRPSAMHAFLCWFTRWRYDLRNKHSRAGAKIAALHFPADAFFISSVPLLCFQFCRLSLKFCVIWKTIKPYKLAWGRKVQNPSVVSSEYSFCYCQFLRAEIHIYSLYICTSGILFLAEILEK